MRIKKLNVWLAAVFSSLMLFAGAFTGTAHAASPYNAGLRVVWKDNGHTVTIYWSYDAYLGQPWWAQDISMYACPDSSTLWNTNKTNHIDGTDLEWGGVPPSGNYHWQNSVTNGGNVRDCANGSYYTLSNGNSVNSGSSVRTIWTFNTNYYYPGNNVSPTIIFNAFYSSGGGGGGGGVGSDCSANIWVSGGGSITSCVVSWVTSI